MLKVVSLVLPMIGMLLLLKLIQQSLSAVDNDAGQFKDDKVRG